MTVRLSQPLQSRSFYGLLVPQPRASTISASTEVLASKPQKHCQVLHEFKLLFPNLTQIILMLLHFRHYLANELVSAAIILK